jgi:hypothetical protein
MTASIWTPGSAVQTATGTGIVTQDFTLSAGQTLVPITSFTYSPGTFSLKVFLNGVLQVLALDYFETSSSSITLVTGATVGDTLELIGVVNLDNLSSSMYDATEVDVAAATTVNIGGVNSNLVRITGASTINSFGTSFKGPIFIRFSGVCTLTHGAALICPGNTNLIVAPGYTIIATPKATSGIEDGWVVSDLNATSFLASGTGAVSRTVTSKLQDYKSIKDYGVAGGGVNDTIAIQNAINANYGKALYFPAGTYYVTGLTITGEIQLFGDGYSRSGLYLYTGTANAHVITINNSAHFVMTDMLISGNKVACPSGYAAVSMTGTNTGAEFHRCFFVNAVLAGLAQAGTADNIVVKDCIAETNGVDGIQLSTASGIVDNCRCVLNGRYGILTTGSLTQITNNRCTGNIGSGIAGVAANYLTVSGNLCINNGTAGVSYAHGIGLNNCDFATVYGNYCAGNIGNGIDFTLGCSNGNIANNVSFANSDNGVAVDSQSNYATITGNNITTNSNAGISNYASPYCTIVGNIVTSNGIAPTACAFAGSAAFPHGISFDGYNNAGTDYYGYYSIVANNEIMFNAYAGTGAGIRFTTATVTPDYNVSIVDNNILFNTIAITEGTGALGVGSKVRGNRGYVTEAVGSATITAALTSVTVTHGLSYTPLAKDITWSLTANPTNDIGNQWISGLTSTQFVLNCRNVPGAATAIFNWRASRN